MNGPQQINIIRIINILLSKKLIILVACIITSIIPQIYFFNLGSSNLNGSINIYFNKDTVKSIQETNSKLKTLYSNLVKNNIYRNNSQIGLENFDNNYIYKQFLRYINDDVFLKSTLKTFLKDENSLKKIIKKINVSKVNFLGEYENTLGSKNLFYIKLDVLNEDKDVTEKTINTLISTIQDLILNNIGENYYKLYEKSKFMFETDYDNLIALYEVKYEQERMNYEKTIFLLQEHLEKAQSFKIQNNIMDKSQVGDINIINNLPGNSGLQSINDDNYYLKGYEFINQKLNSQKSNKEKIIKFNPELMSTKFKISNLNNISSKTLKKMSTINKNFKKNIITGIKILQYDPKLIDFHADYSSLFISAILFVLTFFVSSLLILINQFSRSNPDI